MLHFNKKENTYDDKDQLINKKTSESLNGSEDMVIIPIHNDISLPKINLNGKPRRCCRMIANISLIIGIGMIVISVLFKLQSRVYISKAIESECPVTCVTTCYSRIPFPHTFGLCKIDQRMKCDSQCLSAGIQTAITYSVFFFIFISLGGLCVVVQAVNSCLCYYCYEYIFFKNEEKQAASNK